MTTFAIQHVGFVDQPDLLRNDNVWVAKGGYWTPRMDDRLETDAQAAEVIRVYIKASKPDWVVEVVPIGTPYSTS